MTVETQRLGPHVCTVSCTNQLNKMRKRYPVCLLQPLYSGLLSLYLSLFLLHPSSSFHPCPFPLSPSLLFSPPLFVFLLTVLIPRFLLSIIFLPSLPSPQVDPVEVLSSDVADRAHVFFSTLLWYCLDILCWQDTKALPAEVMKGRSAER